MYRIAGLSIILKNDFIKKDFKMDNTPWIPYVYTWSAYVYRGTY